MAQEHVHDDLGASMVKTEGDQAVEDRLESEDEEFRDEMQNEDSDDTEEGTS